MSPALYWAAQTGKVPQHSLGFEGVRDVRVGKMLTLDVEAPDESAAHRNVHEMCDKLLANPVIEAYEADIRPS